MHRPVNLSDQEIADLACILERATNSHDPLPSVQQVTALYKRFDTMRQCPAGKMPRTKLDLDEQHKAQYITDEDTSYLGSLERSP